MGASLAPGCIGVPSQLLKGWQRLHILLLVHQWWQRSCLLPVQHTAQHSMNCLPLLCAGLELGQAHALKTCNCSVETMAAKFSHLAEVPGVGRRWHRFPQLPPLYSANGGAGLVISAGLLRRVNVSQFEHCMEELSTAGRLERVKGDVGCGGVSVWGGA